MVSYEHKVKNIYLGEHEHILTYDFQNDGDLWFARSDSSIASWWTLTYTTWEWWRFAGSNSHDYNCAFYNSSIFDNKKLKKIKIRWYKWTHQALGICANKTSWSSGVYIRYAWQSSDSTIRVANNTSWVVNTNAWTYTWEITIEMNFETSRIYGNVNGTDYELLTPLWQSFIDAWDNKTLACIFDDRRNGSYVYYRKVQFTTE